MKFCLNNEIAEGLQWYEDVEGDGQAIEDEPPPRRSSTLTTDENVNVSKDLIFPDHRNLETLYLWWEY